MTQIFLLDGDVIDDGSDIQVYIPGPVGPPIVDVGTVLLPAAVVGSIAAPVNRRQRSFLVGSPGAVLNPTIPNPGDNGPWELILFCTDDAKTVTLDNQVNLKLSGRFVGKSGSILCLQWDGNSQYVEGSRNEI